MAEFTLKVRRFQPEEREGPYWETFDVDLDPDALRPRRHPAGQGRRGRLPGRSLLVPRRDLRLLRDEDQRPIDARVQDDDRRGERVRQPAKRRVRADRRRADGQHAGDQGPGHGHGVDPLDQDPPGHTVAAPGGRPARARVHRPAGVDDRHHPVDGLHPVRRLRLLLPLDGGRPRVHRPRRPRQGLSLRRRPARRRDQGAAPRPRPGPARHLRLHPLLLVHRRLPEGRRADGPDHAAPPGRRAKRKSRTRTTATTTWRPSPRSSRRRERSTRRCCFRSRSRPGSRAS